MTKTKIDWTKPIRRLTPLRHLSSLHYIGVDVSGLHLVQDVETKGFISTDDYGCFNGAMLPLIENSPPELYCFAYNSLDGAPILSYDAYYSLAEAKRASACSRTATKFYKLIEVT